MSEEDALHLGGCEVAQHVGGKQRRHLEKRGQVRTGSRAGQSQVRSGFTWVSSTNWANCHGNMKHRLETPRANMAALLGFCFLWSGQKKTHPRGVAVSVYVCVRAGGSTCCMGAARKWTDAFRVTD